MNAAMLAAATSCRRKGVIGRLGSILLDTSRILLGKIFTGFSNKSAKQHLHRYGMDRAVWYKKMKRRTDRGMQPSLSRTVLRMALLGQSPETLAAEPFGIIAASSVAAPSHMNLCIVSTIFYTRHSM